MKKVFVVFMLVSTLLVATGCQQASVTPESTQQSSLKQEQGTATIVIQNQEAVTSKEVTFRENESLLEVMKENFAIKEKDGFITSIDGISQDQKANLFWVYTVNDEMTDKRAQALFLKNNDTITFDLKAF
ncbi:DUF4430 domain-containing protein [Enterococcus casseliflavus]|uniref:DUF4430 domain-containing protein n=1 Tax=Enterococcus casseliflavus TaxID=37734 RepID=UPI0023DB9401|nr:DUF4430 domain-containing protein [Enterococcus casseliflavus]WEL46753.1 DUF4430 domain-containing protein [Enterococcus casseliflavus]